MLKGAFRHEAVVDQPATLPDKKGEERLTMNWEAIGAIGEIVGAVAVVITLAYLAIQVRNSTRIARCATRQAIAETAMEHGTHLISDRELMTALLRDFKGQDQDDVDWARLMAHNYITMRHYENILYQHQTGMIERDEWHGFRENLKAVLEWKSMREFWKHEGHYYSDAFRAEVSAIQSEQSKNGATLSHSYVLDPDKSQ